VRVSVAGGMPGAPFEMPPPKALATPPNGKGAAAPLAATELPSMALETAVKAVKAALAELARQAASTNTRKSARNVKETSAHVIPGDA